MCTGTKGATLQFVFKELYRPKKPCVNFESCEDRRLLGRALRLAHRNCIQLDPCCTSRVYIALDTLEDILRCDPTDQDAKALKKYVGCPHRCCFDLEDDHDDEDDNKPKDGQGGKGKSA